MAGYPVIPSPIQLISVKHISTSIPSLLVATESAPGSRPGTLGAEMASSEQEIFTVSDSTRNSQNRGTSIVLTSAVDPNRYRTLNLNPDPGFWPNLDPDPWLPVRYQL